MHDNIGRCQDACLFDYFSYQDGDGAVVMTNSDNGDTPIHEIMTSIAHEGSDNRWPLLKSSC